jgi:probable rRNA maturation factor
MGVAPAALEGLGLRIVGDEEMTRLHGEFMGEAGPTDVLSFTPPGVGSDDEGLDAEPLGDLVLDWDAVRRQARGNTARAHLDEATLLCVHGLAHLLGHDHRTPAESRRMHRLERRILRGLGVADIARPYVPGSATRVVSR